MNYNDIRDKIAEYHLNIDAKSLFSAAKSGKRISLLDTMYLYADSSDPVEFFVEYIEENKVYRSNINFVGSPVGYGLRIFVLCPICDKSVNSLYLKSGLQCRTCSRLYYESSMKQHNEHVILTDKIRKLQRKLNMSNDSMKFNLPMSKPRYMHQNTFDDLLFRLILAQGEYTKYMRKGLIKMGMSW